MKVYVVEPCDWGEDFEDCHIVAAQSPLEALALLNIKENPNDKYSRDWMQPRSLNVWEIKGIDCNTLTPCELELDLVNDDLENRGMLGPRVEQELRQSLKESERHLK